LNAAFIQPKNLLTPLMTSPIWRRIGKFSWRAWVPQVSWVLWRR